NKIANYVSNIQVDVQTEDSPTATIEGNGTAADKLIVQAVISAQPGNVLTNNGGLYVPTTALPEASFTNSYFDI
ncbi:MAG TPA: hypothetical protein VHA52_10710, partial [Candidatus Babeliaceae bacterium]|nr:hypothetical protein [Candidatus Babeliaceae bacterium]